jgi:hypothetical protein
MTGRIQIEVDWEQCTEENILALEGWCNTRLEKTAKRETS